MTPRSLVLLALLAGPTAAQFGPAPGSAVQAPRAARKAIETGPGNILILLADDVGVDSVEPYGEGTDPPSTPTISKLASQGVLFRNAWANPVCSPTRAAIQTGRFSTRTGIGWIAEPAPTLTGLPLSEVTLPEMLDLGTGGTYAHAAIGKWHLGDGVDVGEELAPNLAGYDHFEGTLNNVTDYFDWPKVENGLETQETSYVLIDQVDAALEWIETAPEPWLCYVAFNSAHFPWHAPPAELHTVDLSQVPPPDVDRRPYYRAMVEAMDTEMGRLLDGLGKKRSNTTVIFLGDNGTPAPVSIPPFISAHAKGTGYEGGVGVPLIVTGPDVRRPGTESDALVHATDVFATVAELAGVDLAATLPNAELDSISFVRHLRAPYAPTVRKLMFGERFFPNGPTAGLPVGPRRPSGNFCQADLGFGGPGTVTLEICGPALANGNELSFEISGAPPNSTGTLLQSAFFNPTPFVGGTVTPLPIQVEIPFLTDAFGQATLDVEMAGVDIDLYYQALVDDVTQTGGFAISNTVRGEFQPWNTKSVRGVRYKLIDWMNGGPEEFYDLELDPFETNDLLLGTMTPQEAAAYATLRGALDDYVTP